jgi:hypothetical protein
MKIMRTLNEFKDSLKSDIPAPDFSPYLQALWFAGKDDWEKAHHIVQDLDDRSAAIIHGYLHRFEGDEANAKFWYARAKEDIPPISLDKEWESLVSRFLAG